MYQNDETHITNLTEYIVEGVKIASGCLNSCYLLRIINQ